MRQFVIEKVDEGQTIIKYLQRILPLAPTSFFYKMFRKKNIVLNDNKKLTGKEKVFENDIVRLYLSDDTIDGFSKAVKVDTEEFTKAFIKYKSPEIVYEDEHLLFINKPSGILSQKSTPSDLSANEWLIGYLLDKGEVNASKLSKFKPSVCNRLDRNTAGILIFAKSLFGANIINPLIKDRSLHKYYLTVVEGHFNKEVHDISYLKKDEKTNRVEISKTAKEGFSLIETYFYPVKYNKKLNVTLLSVLLVTGKSHQIRSCLYNLGFPIVGEAKYRDDESKVSKMFGLKSQVLFAYKLKFPKMENYDSLSEKELTISMPSIIDKLMEE
ncbi:MAG: RluA family pseudouridine synthase [Lachnospiraceae bacterium]|nr:RluA family pseudouridine synthase [Lachnospiraceae bacterium]